MLAMHAPDGFLEPGMAILTGILSFVVVGMALHRSARTVDDKQIPMAALVTAFVFAAQMFNFPVASGTTGHLMGGALAAILLGPWLGTLSVAVVVVVQALLFADGGLTALGYNVMNMAIVPAFGGWAIFRLLRRVLPADVGGVAVAGAIASTLSVVLSAVAFSVQWLFGASAPVAFETVFSAMVGVHALIGVGEGVISGLVIAAVLATRPEMVAGARDLTHAQLVQAPRVSVRTFWIGAIVTALLFAGVVSQFAVDNPDGLETVAIEQGFEASARDHALADGLFADYATTGVANESLSLAMAGLAGVLISLVVSYGLVTGSRRAGVVASPPTPAA